MPLRDRSAPHSRLLRSAICILTGHAHGGQVRLPFIGPIYSPSQGLFPKLTSGLYREGETQMFVSRGIGNGIAPYRFNDGPELAVLILEPA